MLDPGTSAEEECRYPCDFDQIGEFGFRITELIRSSVTEVRDMQSKQSQVRAAAGLDDVGLQSVAWTHCQGLLTKASLLHLNIHTYTYMHTYTDIQTYGHRERETDKRIPT